MFHHWCFLLSALFIWRNFEMKYLSWHLNRTLLETAELWESSKMFLWEGRLWEWCAFSIVFKRTHTHKCLTLLQMMNAFPSLYLVFYIRCPDCIITGTDKPGFLRDIPHHLLLPRTCVCVCVCVCQSERNIQATLVRITDSWFPPFSPAYVCIHVCACVHV